MVIGSPKQVDAPCAWAGGPIHHHPAVSNATSIISLLIATPPPKRSDRATFRRSWHIRFPEPAHASLNGGARAGDRFRHASSASLGELTHA
jgi:hypothetical protein